MKKFTLTDQFDKKLKAVNIQITGQLNVTNIVGIQKQFAKAVKDAKIINLTITDVDDADLSIIQLLKSFQDYCKANNLEINLETNLNDDISQLFNRAGLLSLININ